MKTLIEPVDKSKPARLYTNHYNSFCLRCKIRLALEGVGRRQAARVFQVRTQTDFRRESILQEAKNLGVQLF